MRKKPLGLVELQDKTIEFDLILLQRYQEFSAELSRLSLLGISAIGIAVWHLVVPKDGHVELGRAASDPWIRGYLIAALVTLTASVAFALAHRYLSADSMAYHLSALRRSLRDPDLIGQAREEASRNWRLRWSAHAISWSAAALTTGACFVMLAIVAALWSK